MTFLNEDILDCQVGLTRSQYRSTGEEVMFHFWSGRGIKHHHHQDPTLMTSMKRERIPWRRVPSLMIVLIHEIKDFMSSIQHFMGDCIDSNFEWIFMNIKHLRHVSRKEIGRVRTFTFKCHAEKRNGNRIRFVPHLNTCLVTQKTAYVLPGLPRS